MDDKNTSESKDNKTVNADAAKKPHFLDEVEIEKYYNETEDLIRESVNLKDDDPRMKIIENRIVAIKQILAKDRKERDKFYKVYETAKKINHEIDEIWHGKHWHEHND